MKHILKIMHEDMELDKTIPEYAVFDKEKAHLLFECTEECKFLWIKLIDHHKKLYLTPNGSYVMERYYEGQTPYYFVLSKAEAADFVREWDKEAYIRLFKPREL